VEATLYNELNQREGRQTSRKYDRDKHRWLEVRGPLGTHCETQRSMYEDDTQPWHTPSTSSRTESAPTARISPSLSPSRRARCSARPYEGSEDYVFISYSHEDDVLVFPILERFAAMRLNVWFDEGITFGQEWTDDIADHLSRCILCVLFVSTHA